MGKESRLRDRLIYADGMKTIPMKLPAEGPRDRDKPPHLTHTPAETLRHQTANTKTTEDTTQRRKRINQRIPEQQYLRP